MKGVISDARVAGNDGAFFPSVVCGRLNSARLFSRRVFRPPEAAGLARRLWFAGVGCMGSARQQHAAGEGGEGRYGDQSEGPYHRMDDLRRHIFVVQDVPDGGALSHKDHQQGHKAAGISQKKGRGHGAHGGPAHVHSGAHRIPAGDVGAFIHHLVHRRADVHAQVHHRAGGAQEDGGHKDAGQIQIRKAAVEQTFGIGHDRPVVGGQDI